MTYAGYATGPGPAAVDAVLGSIFTYANAPRTRSEAISVVTTFPTLRAEAGVLTFSDGRRARLMKLSGTIPTVVGGTTYQTPLAIWLPEQFPTRGPIVYVTPTPGLVIKDRHRHVSKDGMVYHHYISGWNAHGSNLCMLIATLQSVFGADPPLFAAPAGGGGSTSSHHSTPPPSYTTSSTSMGGAGGKPSDPRAALLREMTTRMQEKVGEHFKRTAKDIDRAMEVQSKLGDGRELIESGLDTLRHQVAELESQLTAVRERDENLSKWLAEHEGSSDDVDPDELVTAGNLWSEQLFTSVAEAAAAEDLLFEMFNGLKNGVISTAEFMKNARQVSSKQFLSIALSHKIVKEIQLASSK